MLRVRQDNLIFLVAGLLQPDEGQILLEEKPIDGPGPDRRMIIDGREVVGPGLDRTVVFQSPALLPWLTARDNVQLSVTARDPFSYQPELKPCAVRMRKVLEIPAGDH